ncbi:MAG: sigma-54-dependent Fis family transcriptional regulator [Calditrichaeota bacterium]|nr:sigma-54-dependent Fis family transcriptional regulator [Calditrichota bacterium]MCB9391537.1 sigma-54-dependent Fis family transcriptional regulator [Calditrichota bacterium]
MLDHGEIQKVGKVTPQRVNVRVICATHRNLEKLVAEGAFREDLYYRLVVAELKLPPLREREDDVLLIAGHILNVLRIEYVRAHARKLSPEAEHLVRAFPWPGNIRQLRQVLEHAFIRTSKESLEAQDFPVLLKETPAAARVHTVRHEELQEAVAQSLGVQESALVQALGAEGGEWSSTPSIAEKLGISASSARTKFPALSEAGILESAGDKQARRYRLSQTYTLDFSDQNSDIMEIGKLG